MKPWGIRCVEDGYQGQGISRAKGEWHHYEFDTKEEASASFESWAKDDWVTWEVAARTPEERIASLTRQLAESRNTSNKLAKRCTELREQLRAPCRGTSSLARGEGDTVGYKPLSDEEVTTLLRTYEVEHDLPASYVWPHVLEQCHRANKLAEAENAALKAELNEARSKVESLGDRLATALDENAKPKSKAE